MCRAGPDPAPAGSWVAHVDRECVPPGLTLVLPRTSLDVPMNGILSGCVSQNKWESERRWVATVCVPKQTIAILAHSLNGAE